MKLLFITTQNPSPQNDFLEVSILHGLRSIIGSDCIDYPRKKIMYHDFTDSPKEQLHGKGFNLSSTPLEEIGDRDIFNQKFDAVVYGDGHMYGEPPNLAEINELAQGNVWIIDGHDLYGNAPIKKEHEGEIIIGNQYKNCFKRELIFNEPTVYPTGFGIPRDKIREINLTRKDQLHQKTAPSISLFQPNSEMGGGAEHHSFNSEEEYYNDLGRSWFGLTCKKGGWDCFRHYEILAAGTLLLFRDYKKKPPNCSPQNLPCHSYSTTEELESLLTTLVIDNKPTPEYLKMLESQRKWLHKTGTTEARALQLLNTLQENFPKKS